MATAADIFKEAAAEAFAPREVLHVDQWADKYRVIPAKVAVLHGKWDTDHTPYLRRPMRCYTHAQVREIVLMFASQLGKTEAIENMKMYTIDHEPRNMLVMFGNIEAARNFNEDRFLPAVRLSPRVGRHLLPGAHDTKNSKINFDNCIAYFFGSNSKSGRRGNPIPLLFEDELDSYDDPDVEEVDDRVKGGDGTHKIVKTSTPGDEDLGIHKEFMGGSQEYFWVPCPHCADMSGQTARGWQKLLFKHLKWDGGGSASPDEAKATARYICQNRECGTPIYNFHKPQMLKAGLWVPSVGGTSGEGRTVLDVIQNGEGSVAGTGRGNKTGIERERVSFQSSSMNSPFGSATFGDMAKLWVSNHGIPTRRFVCSWDGQPWRVSGDKLEIKELSRLCIPAADGGYRLGEVPQGVLAIVRGIDVQGDRVYVIDRGFGELGVDSWLINVMMIPRKEGLKLADVWPRLPASYKRVGLTERLKVQAEYIDSGHFTDEVYLAVVDRRRMGVRAIPIKGKGAMGTGQRWISNAIEKTYDGKPIKGLPELLTVNSDFWKGSLVGKVRGRMDDDELESEDRPKLEAGVVAGFYLPEIDPEGMMAMWMDQVTSEHKVIEKGRDGKSSKPRYVWKKRALHGQNHLLDAECYAFCGADKAGVRRLRAAAAGKKK